MMFSGSRKFSDEDSYTYILATWEAEIRRISAQENSLLDLVSKITRAKWTGSIAQWERTFFASVKP
jgi:hypothetical protein